MTVKHNKIVITSIELQVSTLQAILMSKILLCSTVICLFVLHSHYMVPDGCGEGIWEVNILSISSRPTAYITVQRKNTKIIKTFGALVEIWTQCKGKKKNCRYIKSFHNDRTRHYLTIRPAEICSKKMLIKCQMANSLDVARAEVLQGSQKQAARQMECPV